VTSKTLVLVHGAAYPPAALQRSVLIVEDDRDMRELLAQVLADEGYGVGTAEDGVGAIRYLRADPPPDLLTKQGRGPGSAQDRSAIGRALEAARPDRPSRMSPLHSRV